MGTSIEVEINFCECASKQDEDRYKGIICKYLDENSYEYEESGSKIYMDIYCPYTCAYIKSHFSEEILKELEGSCISITPNYLENNPKEVINL